jgi:LysR family transcriptional regulator, mexEF-oprN operon transcriptional activator
MALARLRDQFKDPLFVRTAEGMDPTSRAIELLAPIGDSLANIQRALTPRQFDPSTAKGRFRLGSPDDLEVVLLPRVLARLQREAPGLSLSVRATDFHAAPVQLDRGEVDVAVTASPPELGAHHRHEVLYVEDFAVLCDAAYLGLGGSLSAKRPFHMRSSPSRVMDGERSTRRSNVRG